MSSITNSIPSLNLIIISQLITFLDFSMSTIRLILLIVWGFYSFKLIGKPEVCFGFNGFCQEMFGGPPANIFRPLIVIASIFLETVQ
ncbi:hypothetical protein SAMN05444412_11723 [Rhodonellum ikkaensis]|nr:hypothetical protein SAMN05444412_11723 [Rhodonellum ikkaensis]